MIGDTTKNRIGRSVEVLRAIREAIKVELSGEDLLDDTDAGFDAVVDARVAQVASIYCATLIAESAP